MGKDTQNVSLNQASRKEKKIQRLIKRHALTCKILGSGVAAHSPLVSHEAKFGWMG